MRIAIYGGTFDPIHLAHLTIAQHAVDELALDRLVFVPSYVPPHKRHQTITASHHRLAMTQLAISDNPYFDVSDYEILKKGTSFTVDTLAYFSQKFQLDREQLFLVIGADNYKDFLKWKEPQKILQLATLVIANRPNCDTSSVRLENNVILLNSPLLEISASYIRQLCKQNRSIRYLLPENVRTYIAAHELYSE